MAQPSDVVENLTMCIPRARPGLDPNAAVVVSSTVTKTLPPNHVLIRLDRFGFSANNITYQVLGEAPHYCYFDFHPAPTTDSVCPVTHGVIPVWGFGGIVASTHPIAKVGERVYGYFAPTKFLLLPLSTSDISSYAFYVPRPHLPADRRPYNQVIRCSNDPLYDPSSVAENLTMLYRPLFWTSYWCEDWLYSSSYKNAKAIIISSASAKTAFCLAYCIKKRIRKVNLPGIKVIGLTSRENVDFTNSLKIYDGVVDYGNLEREPTLRVEEGSGDQWLYVDVAGNEDLNQRVFSRFGQAKAPVAGVKLGMSSLSPSTPAFRAPSMDPKSGPQPQANFVSTSNMEAFFTPEWLVVRRKQLSVAEISGMQAAAWRDLMVDCRSWVELQNIWGPEDVKRTYRKVVARGVGPDVGLICSLWEGVDDDPAGNTVGSICAVRTRL